MGGTSDPNPTGNGALPNPLRDYYYPDYHAYRAMRPGSSANLRHGVIFSVNSGTKSVNAAIDDPTQITQAFLKNINPNLAKSFQYNPSDIGFSLSASGIAPTDSDTAGGGAPPISVGLATSKLNLHFDREQEMRAANSKGIVATPRSKLFKRLGVQRDLVDLYRVLLGNQDELAKGSPILVPSDASIASMTSGMVDFAAAGQPILFGLICFAFNDDFVVYGKVTGFSWNFTKWNFDLVPVWLDVEITLGVYDNASLTTVSGAGTTPVGGSYTSNTVTSGGPGFNPANSGTATRASGNSAGTRRVQ